VAVQKNVFNKVFSEVPDCSAEVFGGYLFPSAQLPSHASLLRHLAVRYCLKSALTENDEKRSKLAGRFLDYYTLEIVIARDPWWEPRPSGGSR
jgi:hypothetical protein